jgi:hypothetical protein
VMEVVYVPIDVDRVHGLELAITWFVDAPRLGVQEPHLLVPLKQSIDQVPVLFALSKQVRKETASTIRRSAWRGGPVLAVWPSMKTLEYLTDWAQPTAICVIQWSPRETDEWLRAHQARDLTGRSPQYQAPSLADPVVLEAMQSLTQVINLETGIDHSLDRAKAVQTFWALLAGRHDFSGTEIYRWAVANGWKERGAEGLRKVAEGVLAGTRYRIRDPGFRSDVLDQWRKASEEKTKQ